MTCKTILVCLNDAGRTAELLSLASVLARRHDAHMLGLYVIPAVTVYSDVGMVLVPVISEEYRNHFKARQETVKQAFDARACKDGLKAEWLVVESDYPDVATATVEQARMADLVIVSQSDGSPSGAIESDLVERIVMESARPVLVVPVKGSFSAVNDDFGEKVIVGINGTAEASRAMFDAIPLLRHAKDVRLVWVDPYKERGVSGEVPGAWEATVLSRHGIKAVAEPLAAGGRDAGEALLMRAGDLGADLLVMGAYAHSRMREYILGGATLHVLRHMTIPVLMSH